MNKRALRRLMKENDLKSPDILTVILIAENRMDACSIANDYYDVIGTPFPFGNYENWSRGLSPPVELYFRFDHKKHMMRFIRLLRKDFPKLNLIF